MGVENYTMESVIQTFKGVIAKKQLSLELIDRGELEKAVIMLSNRLRLDRKFNANITIAAGSCEMADQYGEALIEVLGQLFPNSCGSIDEKDLLDERIRNFRLKRNKIILVKNCMTEDPEKLFTALVEIEKQGWEPAVILCTAHEGLERLKAYDVQDYRLYHYLCGHKICIADINIDNILKLTVESLKREGFSCRKEFCEKLDRYIQAVYPEAQLTQKAFAEDLVFRIYQTHFQKVVSGNELDASDVPYSAKAEKLAVENTSSPSGEETKKRIPELKAVETHFTELEKSKNVLLLAMSTLPYLDEGEKPETNNYCVVEKNELNELTYRTFLGVSQLEPGTKFFISKLAERKLKADKIIILATKETLNKNRKYDNKSAVDIYCENIVKYLEEGETVDLDLDKAIVEKPKETEESTPKKLDTCHYIRELYAIQTENEPQKNDGSYLDQLNEYLDVQLVDLDENALQKIISSLNALAKDRHVNLFINLQGGYRTVMYTLFAAMTMLRDRNVTIKEMFSVNYSKPNLVNPIIIETNEYAILDLVSAIRSFTGYGKVEELEKFLKKRKTGEKENDLLKIMRDIDGCMQINNPEGFTEALDKLAENNALLLNKDFYEDRQFKLIVGDLKDTYQPLIQPDTSVLDQIQWFGEKAFLTSALTFIEDKIPGFMIGDDDDSILKVSYPSKLKDDDIRKIGNYSEPFYDSLGSIT